MNQGKILRRFAKHALLFLGYGAAGALVTLFGVFLWLGVANKPDLKPWHVVQLHEEFTRADGSRVRDMEAYRNLEVRLFEELREKVYPQVSAPDRRRLNRYSAGSSADPEIYPDNGNRSYELAVAEPRAGVLMIHGLSDSPYVLRALAERLHRRGGYVVGLRLPGHGTVPAGLASVHWEDWAEAVRLAARHVRERVGPDAPVYFVGFSTGAALSVEYALARLQGADLPVVDGLVLMSPAIGVDPLAWLTVWQARLAQIPGFAKLAWLDLRPEYDPYKYNSFAVNGGQQIYALTQVIDERITELAAHDRVQRFPRTLVFQSVADATVSPIAVVRVFLGRLEKDGHELVVFDINRLAESKFMLRSDLRKPAEALLAGPEWPFDVTLITNRDEQSNALVALRRTAGSSTVRTDATELAWPRGVFSLSHVALPIPPDDPIYGEAPPPREGSHIYLGQLELAGEQGLLAVPADVLVRLRFNPFFSYVENRTQEFLGLAGDDGDH